MTRDDIIRLALEANILTPVDLLKSNQWRQDTIRELERFAHLIAVHTLSNIDPSKLMSYQEGFEAAAAELRRLHAELERCKQVCAATSEGWRIDAALAEPVQEPVAWRWGYRSVTTGEMDWRGYVEIAADPKLRSPEIIMQPLYTAPPQRPSEPRQEPVACEPQYANDDGWCDWVCPKPIGYLMQCCGCDLIHEVESRVAKYQPRPSEEFEVVDDPDLQVQLRMKRRDDISPKRKPLTEEEITLIVADCSASAHRHDDFSFARAIERAHNIKE